MKVNVINVNFDNIVSQIMYDTNFRGNDLQYCIMNQDTFDFLVARNSDLAGIEIKKQGTELFNLDIAICPNLKFGEIDVK